MERVGWVCRPPNGECYVSPSIGAMQVMHLILADLQRPYDVAQDNSRHGCGNHIEVDVSRKKVP